MGSLLSGAGAACQALISMMARDGDIRRLSNKQAAGAGQKDDMYISVHPLTLQKELQYPVELGTSIGGRIVGELHVDYLLPTYQKNDFDRSDASWEQTREAICGVGPFLPKSRKAMGFTEENASPLCLLVNAYRRVDKGTNINKSTVCLMKSDGCMK